MSENWDQKFVALADHVASWSKDRSRKVGCVVVGPHNEVRSTGYNGFPRGVDDTVEARHVRPVKYLWAEHAERNAFYNAARMGVSLDGCSLYVSTLFPCMDCARGIVQVGIVRVVTIAPDFEDAVWGEQFRAALVLFSETDVKVQYF